MGRVQDDPLLQGLGSLLGGWEAPGAGGRGSSPQQRRANLSCCYMCSALGWGQKWGDRNQPHAPAPAPAPAGQAMEGQMLTPPPGSTHSCSVYATDSASGWKRVSLGLK